MRLLIVTSSTGGGHNMRANSLAHWMRRQYPRSSETQIHKCLENTHGLYSFGVGLYNWIQATAPWLHHLYFNALEIAAPCHSKRKIFGASRFRAILEHVRPQVVLSTHGSLNHGFFELTRDTLGAENVRCVTYCGELFGKYGFSRHWVNPSADLFIGAVPETCAMARVLGMPASRTAVGGFLLNPSFYDPPLSADERSAFLRNELGLDPSLFTLLLSTSEHGAHNHPALLEALYAARQWLDLERFQVIALCGRQEETLARVRTWGRQHPELRLCAMPRTERMATFMRCSDAVVARPGTGTTSEAIQSACPVIFNGLGGVMPQEWITVKFARRHDLAEEMHQPADLPGIVARWLESPERHRQIRTNMIEARPRAHPADIVQMLKTLSRELPEDSSVPDSQALKKKPEAIPSALSLL